MDPKVANQEGGDNKMKRKPESWKLSKIPVNQVYKLKALRIFPSYAIKDFETTFTIGPTLSDKSFDLISQPILRGFKKRKYKYLHLGLVQVAVKPLIRDGLGAPIVVCLRDKRHRDFKNSLLAMVQPNLSEGPFNFNCFPSFSVSMSDAIGYPLLTLDVSENGCPLAVTYRIVCKAMVDINSQALEKLTLGKTTYFQVNSQSLRTTIWDDVLDDKDETSKSTNCQQ